jgi:hypothetical protein
MRPVHWSTRVAIVTAMMLGLMLTSLVAAPSYRTDAAANTAKITLHVVTCPETMTTLFTSCHDQNRLAGASFTVAGVSRSTDANGVVSWGPGAGTHTIHMFSAEFAEFGKAWVYCKDQTSGVVLVDGRTTTGNVSITTVAGHLTICDWYNLTPAPSIPSPAVITLHVIECPATTTTLFATCHNLNRLAGIGFTVAGVSRFSDTNGIVSWGPSAGTYTIHMFSTDFATYGKAWIYCKDQTSGVVLFDGRTTTGNVSITTVAGDLTICDWYNLT